MRISLALCFALLTTGCCCPRETGATGTRTAKRQFLVLNATPLEASSEGPRQILIESHVVTVRRPGPIAALESAERLGVTQAPAWRTATPIPSATFGAGSEVMHKPSVVTAEGEEVLIQVRASSGNDADQTGVTLRIVPTLTAEGLSVELSYQQHEGGRLVYAIPALTLYGPAAGHSSIIEALDVR